MDVYEKNHPDTKPWYRQFWPWVLIAIPLSSVIMGIVLITLATMTADGLVADDYYKQGLAINRVLARDRKAVELGITALMRFDLQRGSIHIQLQSSVRDEWEDRLVVKMLHPLQEQKDIQVAMQHDGVGGYSGKVASLPLGNWHVLLESEGQGWRLVGRARLPDQTTVQLDAT